MEKKNVVKKVFKVIGVIVLIAFVLFMVNTIRKLIIIKEIQRTASQYTSSTNYHVKSIASGMNGEDRITTINCYYKEGNKLTTLEMSEKGEKTYKLSIYDNGEKKDVFTETKEQKMAEIDAEDAMNFIMPIYDYFEGGSNMQLICIAIASKVENIEYKGKKCYRVGDFVSSDTLVDINSNNSEVYIEKDTGLVIRTHFGSSISEREYEFNNVQDEVFIEPDLKEYKVIKNS